MLSQQNKLGLPKAQAHERLDRLSGAVHASGWHPRPGAHQVPLRPVRLIPPCITLPSPSSDPAVGAQPQGSNGNPPSAGRTRSISSEETSPSRNPTLIMLGVSHCRGGSDPKPRTLHFTARTRPFMHSPSPHSPKQPLANPGFYECRFVTLRVGARSRCVPLDWFRAASG